MANNSKKEKEIEFDEDRAYMELCEIIAEVLQTQDINLFQVRIEQWKRKYPYEKFSKNLKAKIDYLLNQYYTELVNSILKTIKINKEKKEFNQKKAIVKLYKIIKETNDIKDLNKKVEKWKKEYPIDDFMDMYKRKAKKMTTKKNLEENAFDTEKAFYDLYHLLKTNATYEELQQKVDLWESNYSIGDKYSEDDFKRHTNEVKRFLDEEYIYSVSKEDEKQNSLDEKRRTQAIQSASYAKFIKVLKGGNMAKIVEWIYKNRNISFGSFYKDQIIAQTAFKFPISALENEVLKMNLNERGLSFYEYKNIDESRKYIITMFLKYLMKDKQVSEATFQKAFNKSEEAKRRVVTEENGDDNKKYEDSPTLVVKLDKEIEDLKKEESDEQLLEPIEIDSKNLKSKTEKQGDFEFEDTEGMEDTSIVIDLDQDEVKENLVIDSEAKEDKKTNVPVDVVIEQEETTNVAGKEEIEAKPKVEVKDLKEEQIDDTTVVIELEEAKVDKSKEKEQEEIEDLDDATLVINLNEDKKIDSDETLVITELESKRAPSKSKKKEEKSKKEEPVEEKPKEEETYVIFNPDFLRVAYEKSKMAERMSSSGNKNGSTGGGRWRWPE